MTNKVEQIETRAAVLECFIRNQCGLQNARPHNPGPGSVELNHEEALLCADALHEVAGLRADALRHRMRRTMAADSWGEWPVGPKATRAQYEVAYDAETDAAIDAARERK